MILSAKSMVFVTVQFLCLGILLLTGPKIPTHIGFMILEIISVLIAIWAIFSMRSGKLNVFTELRTGAMLISHGPYL